MARKGEDFKNSLIGTKVPVLTLDNKWYRLFRDLTAYPAIVEKEKELNELLKRQGKINTELRDLKVVKKRLMDEIMSNADEDSLVEGQSSSKTISDNKKLIEECNEKMEAYQEEMKTIPGDLEAKNKELMVETCVYCYESLHRNHRDIQEIDAWLDEIKEELRKKIIQKQSMEIQNRQIYAYMSDIFGERSNKLFDIED